LVLLGCVDGARFSWWRYCSKIETNKNKGCDEMSYSYAIMLVGTGLINAAVIGVVALFFRKQLRKNDLYNERTERRAKTREEESRLSMKLMSANTNLAISTGIALKEKRVNGKMDAALLQAEKAQLEYFEFINRLAASQVAKT